MTDAWLNFVVSTEWIYTKHRVSPDSPAYKDFTPGRGLPSKCLESATDGYCRDWKTDKVPASGSDLLDRNRVRPGDIVRSREGSLVAALLYAEDETDFETTTIGSLTSCQPITHNCNIAQSTKDSPILARSLNSTITGKECHSITPVDFTYNCTRDRAGLDLQGKFSDMAGQRFAITHYTSSAMDSPEDFGVVHGPTHWYAVVLKVQSDFVTYGDFLDNREGWNNLPRDGEDETTWASSILSCNTTMLDVVSQVLDCILLNAAKTFQRTHRFLEQRYSYENREHSVTSRAAMDGPVSDLFFENMDPSGQVAAQLQQGLLSTFTSDVPGDVLGDVPGDVAAAWGLTYDQSILTQGIDMLITRPALSITENIETQATRIPRAPFFTLIILDLLYALIGTYLAIKAFIVQRQCRDVIDAQIRLSTLAVVAESFENPAWGDDAKDVEMLFAERRGESTRRIALTRRKGGGRRFKQIVDPSTYSKTPSTLNTPSVDGTDPNRRHRGPTPTSGTQYGRSAV
ncbi:MAG: hypothetical protein Q9171_003536 [Xanthocarpia ochracea]